MTDEHTSFRSWLLLGPAMLLLVTSLAAPLALLVAYSFSGQRGNFGGPLTVAHYALVLSGKGFVSILLRSIVMSLTASIIAIVLAYPVAWFIAFRARAKFLWLLLVTVPFWTSYLLRVFAWKVILGYNGVINSALLTLHFIGQPLEFLLYNRFAVVLTLIHAYAAFAVLPIFVALEKIDPALLEAAADLGDGPARRFLRVTLPLSLNGVIAGFVLIFIPATGDYVTPSLVGGPDGLMVANLIQAQFGRADNWPLGAALAITAIAVVSLVSLGIAGLTRTASRAFR